MVEPFGTNQHIIPTDLSSYYSPIFNLFIIAPVKTDDLEGKSITLLGIIKHE